MLLQQLCSLGQLTSWSTGVLMCSLSLGQMQKCVKRRDEITCCRAVDNVDQLGVFGPLSEHKQGLFGW